MAEVTPFTFIDSITRSKIDIYDQTTAKHYVPFIVNRHLSYFFDTILWANDMNIAHHIRPADQYRYLLSMISKRSRFTKWAKKQRDNDVDMIMQFEQCNDRRAAEIVSLLSPSEIASVRKLYAGMTDDGKRSRRNNAADR